MTRPAANGRIRVLCVDDHVVISMAMRATIDASSDMRCVGCIERADMLVETVSELKPDAGNASNANLPQGARHILRRLRGVGGWKKAEAPAHRSFRRPALQCL